MDSTRKCVVELPTTITLDYDRQTDTLRILIGRVEEQPDEELLVEDSDIVLGLKDNRLVTITIFNISKKLEESST
ncbi:MAG: DUF2283 domain-containing protein [Desulfurococcaceae archaeon]|jgi:uncharacterized protein YuzE|nr:DUF2283 domain-containing protein [Desulfurococcaceae archaeon]